MMITFIAETNLKMIAIIITSIYFDNQKAIIIEYIIESRIYY